MAEDEVSGSAANTMRAEARTAAEARVASAEMLTAITTAGVTTETIDVSDASAAVSMSEASEATDVSEEAEIRTYSPAGAKTEGRRRVAQILKTEDESSSSSSSPSVTFNSRAVLIDGTPRFLASGGFHYPRASPGSWRPIMQQMKANGLNTITTYAFWELHERTRGTYDWGQVRPEANVTQWLQIAREEGLWVHMRIGPYINANWNNGGFPWWLRDVPGIHFRTANAPFQKEMGRWFNDFVDHIRPFLLGNGNGPVISLQVENEYSYSSAGDMAYIDWAAALCSNASKRQALCTMCNNTGSPTLPDYSNTIFTCNAGCNSKLSGGGSTETWIDGHNRAYPNQPSLFSEIEVADPGWADLPASPSRAAGDGKRTTIVIGLQSQSLLCGICVCFVWSVPLSL